MIGCIHPTQIDTKAFERFADNTVNNIMNSPYFETLSDTVFGAAAYLDEAKAVLVLSGDLPIDSLWCSEIFNAGPINYGQTRSHTFEISTLKGKPTRKGFHVTIYRMESGRYELTTYVL